MTKPKHLACHQGLSETLNGTMESLEKFSDSFNKLKEEIRVVAFTNSVGQNTITTLNIAIQNKCDSGELLQFATKAITDLDYSLRISEALSKKTLYWAARMETATPFVDMSVGK